MVSPASLKMGVFSLFVIATTGSLSACQTANSTGNQPIVLKGAGATFPAPLYQRWITEYTNPEDRANITIKYDSVGSGKGIDRFLAQEVDFGATDAPLNASDHEKFPTARGNPIQIPMTGGLVVFAYNLDDNLGSAILKLSRKTYCGIVSGEIKNWKDPKIATDNPSVKLPDLPILFVHRSDSSGTTFIFTNHLKAACPNWKAGSGKSVTWPEGIGAKGNEGMSLEIKQRNGAIGYIEYSYAINHRLTSATLENKSGQFVTPTPDYASEALTGITPAPDFTVSVPDPQGPNAYPIVGLTWLLLYSQYNNPDTSRVLKDFIHWSLTDGKQYAQKMGYFPLPKDLQERVFSTLDNL